MKTILALLLLLQATLANSPRFLPYTWKVIPMRYEVHRSQDPENVEILCEWGNLQEGHQYQILQSSDLREWYNYLAFTDRGEGKYRTGFCSACLGEPTQYFLMVETSP